MKKTLKKALVTVLALVMIISCFAGCSSKGKTLMKIEDTEISVNLYKLYLSRLKGMLCSSYSFGEAALADSFWDTVMSKEGMTYNTYYTSAILDSTKTYLSAMYEFDIRGLELPKSTLDEIDARIDELIEADAKGSKTEFNAILSNYGVNYKMLREAYIIEEKIEALKNNIYGANGELIAKNLVDDYYEQNYARFKQAFYETYEYVYLTDDNGDDIYFNNDGRIAYDKSAEDVFTKKDENGKDVLDKNGDIVFFRTVDDLTRIAYDKKNGSRINKTDDDGNKIIRQYEKGSAEMQAVLDLAAATMAKTEKGDYDTFDTLADESEYNGGYYVTRESNLDSPEVIEALFEMEVGEVRAVSSEYGIHIVMRYELEEDGYKKNDNSDFFISTQTGNYVFLADMKNQLLSSYLEPHMEKIIVDEALLEGVDMKSIEPNYYY